ncbi:MAG TPA: RNA-binding protein [Bacteroidota bacterium]|jgi:RNA recognition motif-containing protein|nr:RNA-binding protein [Bacteroidota bacterium]
MNIFAGNLSLDVTEDDLRKAFRAFGEVSFVNIVRDRHNKMSAGFGFLQMPVPLEAEAAIKALHATDLKGKSLTVNEARPRTPVPAPVILPPTDPQTVEVTP